MGKNPGDPKLLSSSGGLRDFESRYCHALSEVAFSSMQLQTLLRCWVVAEAYERSRLANGSGCA